MAKFIEVETTSNEKCLINVEMIAMVKPTEHGVTVFMDATYPGGTSMVVNAKGDYKTLKDFIDRI